jgi:hypothetical protein
VKITLAIVAMTLVFLAPSLIMGVGPWVQLIDLLGQAISQG